MFLISSSFNIYVSDHVSFKLKQSSFKYIFVVNTLINFGNSKKCFFSNS